MATSTKPRPKPKQTPTVSLRCRKCGGTRIRVSRVRQQLSRSFRRDQGVNRRHLHAAVACLSCKREWWSAHETALAVSERIDKAGKETEIVGVPPGDVHGIAPGFDGSAYAE